MKVPAIMNRGQLHEVEDGDCGLQCDRCGAAFQPPTHGAVQEWGTRGGLVVSLATKEARCTECGARFYVSMRDAEDVTCL